MGRLTSGPCGWDEFLGIKEAEHVAHYKLWISVIERAMQTFFKKHSGKLTIKYINDFFKSKGVFDDVDGVMFQDITNNPKYWIIDKFQYKKRIQIVVYNLPIITTFALEFEGKCV